jgi:hypothetical protein
MVEPRAEQHAEPEAPMPETTEQHEPALTAQEIAAATPERLLVVPVLRVDGESRFVLARWPDWPHPTLLSLAPPAAHDTLDETVASVVWARLGLTAEGPARMAAPRIPVRMGSPRLGLNTTGWLRGVLQPVSGEPEVDVLLEGFEVLPLHEALAALPTEVERTVLSAAAALTN